MDHFCLAPNNLSSRQGDPRRKIALIYAGIDPQGRAGGRVSSASRRQQPEAGLSKVPIQSKCLPQALNLHELKTNAVGQTQVSLVLPDQSLYPFPVKLL